VRAGQSSLREVRVAFDIPVAIINNQLEFATIVVCFEIMRVQIISICLHLQHLMAKTERSSVYDVPIDCTRSDLMSNTHNYNDYQRALKTSDNFTIPVNSTLEISCAGQRWKCVTLVCDLSKFLTKKTGAVEMNLQISFTPPNIGKCRIS